MHIDFGHFLGNFKSKFGVKRERVPFVLTDDFIYIITKGGSKDSKEFYKLAAGLTSLLSILFTAYFCSFKNICEDAFLKMREHGPLFLNLFTMMLSCGIPELRTRDDISYIRLGGKSMHTSMCIINFIFLPPPREALCLGETRESALENFRKKMSEALNSAWSVSLNWYFHNVARTGN